MSTRPARSTTVTDPHAAPGSAAAAGLAGPTLVVSWAVGATLVLLSCGGSAPRDLDGAAARGATLTRELGCAACHGGADQDAEIGPSWVGSWNDEIVMSDGERVRFDASYVVSSVRQPDLQRRVGDWRRMPAYDTDQLTDDELNDIVAYLEALG